MSVHSAIRAFLTTDVSVAALVGERVYTTALPENTINNDGAFPAIAMHQISRVPTSSHSGDSGYTDYRFQFNIWAKSEDDVEAVAAALTTALNCYRGAMPAIGDAQITVESAFLDSEDRDKDDPGDGREMWVARQDYLISVAS